jgi:hypothetical protein
MHAPNPENASEISSARGLGTLVSHRGENVIITHDHWGEVLDILAYARLWSGDGELLLEMDGESLKELIRYRDGGTMILSVPQELIPDQRPTGNRPAELGSSQGVQVGDRVLVVVRRPETPHQVEVLEALVESVEAQLGLPSLTLRRLNGKLIEPGDSGGGVWVDGRLVGNLWYRMKHRVLSEDENGATVESLRLTDLAVAATHPLEVG